MLNAMNATGKPTLIAVAHGTRHPAGIAEVTKLIDLVRIRRPDLRVQLCWLERATPSLAEMLTTVDGPVVVVPALLSTGYHVKVDITATVAGRPDTAVAAQLGPDVRITQVVSERLGQATALTDLLPAKRPVMLIGAGSSDPQALTELAEVGRQLERIISLDVLVGQLTDATSLSQSPQGTLVANYLLAPGYFNDLLHRRAGPGLVVADPIGADPLVADVILDRYEVAVKQLS